MAKPKSARQHWQRIRTEKRALMWYFHHLMLQKNGCVKFMKHLPNTKSTVVHNITELNAIYKDYDQKTIVTVYAILSKERARDGYMKRPAVSYSIHKRGIYMSRLRQCSRNGRYRTIDGTKYIVNANQFFFMKENRQKS